MDELDIFIRENCERLRNSKRTLQDIYEIVFSVPEAVMAETGSISSKSGYMTYGEAEKRINKLASAIYRLNKGQSSFIALRAENSPEWIILFWAILKSGNKPYLVNLRQPEEFTDSIIETLQCRYIIYIGAKPKLKGELLDFAELEAEPSGDEKPESFGNELAITTSGTTLKHKICIYSGNEITNMMLNTESIVNTNREIKSDYKGKVKQFVFLPLYHIFGLEATYLWFSFGHVAFVFPKNLSPDTLIRTIRDHEVTHIFAVPLFWHTVEKSLLKELSNYDEKTRKKFEKGVELSIKLQHIAPKLGRAIAKKMFREIRMNLFGESVKFCISGGSYIKASTLKIINALGYPLYNGYGMSEIGITSVELSLDIKDRMLGSIGKPFNSVEYRIDKDSRLQVRGESVCRKVIVDGELLENDGWFDTGDIMHGTSDGRYYIDGRASDVVFSDNGENLNPDLPEKLLNLSGVKQYTVTGDENNENLMLVVQVPRGMLEIQKKLLEDEIHEKNSRLPQSYQIKKIRYTFDPIMNEKDIKVSRAYLRKMINEGKIVLFESLYDESIENEGEETEIRKALRTIFAQVLGRDESEITANGHFINDLGGTSLDYFTLISEIDRKFDITIDYENGEFGYCLNDFETLVNEKLTEK